MKRPGRVVILGGQRWRFSNANVGRVRRMILDRKRYRIGG